MKKILVILMCIAATGAFAYAQTRKNSRFTINRDSIDIKKSILNDTIGKPMCLPQNIISSQSEISLKADSLITETTLVYTANKKFDFQIPDLNFNKGPVTIFSWGNGAVTGFVGGTSFPGLMRMETGEIGINQKIGNFSLYSGWIINKYGFFQGLHTQHGVTANLTYNLSPKVAFTAFGTYYFGQPPVMGNGLPMVPAMAGFYGVSKFGGYVNYDAGEHMGVLVGGQAVQQIGTQKYEAEPIVTPYVKIGSGKKRIVIGLPVGQILHGILRR